MKELTEKDFICKNHVYITDYVDPQLKGGFFAYGSIIQGIKYLFHLPKLFLHQIICPDNPMLRERSNYNYQHYDKFIGTPKYAMVKTIVLQIHKTKRKTLEFIGI